LPKVEMTCLPGNNTPTIGPMVERVTTTRGGVVANPRYIQSVARALEMLEHLGAAGGEVGVTDMSRRLGVHVSTVSRVLVTLERAGFVERGPGSEKFRLGERVLQLASHSLSRLELRELAVPYLKRLESRSEETATLAAFQDHRGVTTAFVPSRHLLSVTGAIGRPAAAHCTALGKALLAFQPAEVISEVATGELRRYTPHTVVEPVALRRELAAVGARGYAVNWEERELGLSAVAAPVRDWRGDVVAALGISGPRQRLTRRRIEELAPYVVGLAGELSAQFGYREGNETTVPGGTDE
jgi:DNA-binding IclR family transcriptional regulator